MNLKKSAFFILIFASFLFIHESCKQEEKIDLSKTDYIYLKDKKFKHKGNEFFPVMLNYVVTFRKINKNYVISPIKDYEDPKVFEGNTVDSTLTVLRGHLQLIKELGFNSIRLVGLDRISIQEKHESGIFRGLKSDEIHQILINCVKQFLKISKELDLRIMLLLNGPIKNPVMEDFTIELLKEFKDNPTIFAYDFLNEPLYFDNKDLKASERGRAKESAFEIVENWKKMIKKNAPNQLITIGFSEPIEVFEWDPAILPVDFVAFHTYHPLRAPNEIYWYSKYIDKPWMIGETSLPADNDSISYKEQKQYLKEIYQRTLNCGGAGIAWWSFQDVEWGNYEHDYTSIMNHEGETVTKDGKYIIKGTLKPVAYEFARLKNYKKNDDCFCMPNYYNMIGYKNFVIKGKVINSETKKPIEGAVIRGWTKWWGIGANTFTNYEGEFTLFSNKKFEHFAISAPGMSFVKFDSTFEYKPIKKDTLINFNNLEDTELEYHSISYSPFLEDKSILDKSFIAEPDKSYILNFKKDTFNTAVFETKIDIVELEQVKFSYEKK